MVRVLPTGPSAVFSITLRSALPGRTQPGDKLVENNIGVVTRTSHSNPYSAISAETAPPKPGTAIFFVPPLPPPSAFFFFVFFFSRLRRGMAVDIGSSLLKRESRQWRTSFKLLESFSSSYLRTSRACACSTLSHVSGNSRIKLVLSGTRNSLCPSASLAGVSW